MPAMPTYGASTGGYGGAGGGSDVFGYKPAPLSFPNPMQNMAAATPDYEKLIAALSQNILSGLNGQVPQDVDNQIWDAVNARQLGSGTGGTPFARNDYLRNLGLTSLGMQGAASNQLLSYLPVQSRTATLDPLIQAEIEKYNSLVTAAPDPAARGNWEMEQFNRLNALGNMPGGSARGISVNAGVPTAPPAINMGRPTSSNVPSNNQNDVWRAENTGPAYTWKTTPAPTWDSPLKTGPYADTYYYPGTPGNGPYGYGWGGSTGSTFDTSGSFESLVNNPLTPQSPEGSFGGTVAGPFDGGYSYGSSPTSSGTGSMVSGNFGTGEEYYSYPSNFYTDLSTAEQDDYVAQVLANSGIDSSLYE